MGSTISSAVNTALQGDAFGYVAIILVGFFFGSNYVPAKKVPTGDGMAFQWFMCVGIFFWTLLMAFLGGFVPVVDPYVSCANTLVCRPLLFRLTQDLFSLDLDILRFLTGGVFWEVRFGPQAI